MTPFEFFLFCLAFAFGVIVVGAALLVVFFAFNLVKGWLVGDGS